MAERPARLRSLRSLHALDSPELANYVVQGSLTDEQLAGLTGLTVFQIGEFREIFRLVDRNMNGYIDTSELRQLMQSLHFDSVLLSEDFFEELIRRVKEFTSAETLTETEQQDMHFSFDELMLCILKRPTVDYSKQDVMDAFQTLAGKNCERGTISVDKLSRAVYRGAGGIEPLVAEDIMAMMEHCPGGKIDYMEIIDLMMGVEKDGEPTTDIHPNRRRQKVKSSKPQPPV
mmetsp:Transcript_2627/g.3944  ORF Transcript_2627/g.3944 Transcript_2627/m.3944 type:complete len:231 (-) Transcript_2627:270-962(-)|eukprot:CAMPEP_0185029118 /NCGR_PEP_ID=MMETSP1103-20130426/15232_1 /TAXON_ID=36769 /ORGANISM="Paraphysomonas bandaiensis, Strain Caron Lab Isolate" /LENGTH=230 /DNA_ID=CAMNT_0027563739 /DNA_START=37 /DNA_END=729 /DNA_ORIENTATION=-